MENTRFPIPLNRSTQVLAFRCRALGINISCVEGIRSIKPNKLCLPGLHPVTIDAHATEETVGNTDSISINEPFSIRAAKFGIRPSTTSFLTKLYGIPSRPITTARLGPSLHNRLRKFIDI